MKTKTPLQPEYFIPEPLDNTRLAHLCGPLDENLRQISAALDVTIFRRGERFIVSGTNAVQAVQILERFYAIANKVVPIEEVQLALVEQRSGLHSPGTDIAPLEQTENLPDIEIDSPQLKTRRHDLRGRTPHQIRYLRNVLEHDISFGIGPAGTGKTYLAVAHAASLLERGDINRIILSRPAVEAGERLGFLPGDMKEKVDPYLRPLYDALYDMMKPENVERCLTSGIIEVAPLAFMRGRTLANAVVILDEAQNTTTMQMKMFLTRLGENSKMIVTGDPTQVDLPRGEKSGLVEAISLLDGVEGVHISRFNDKDVVRHALVGRIVRAYEADTAKKLADKAIEGAVR